MVRSTIQENKKTRIIWQVSAIVLALALWEIIALTVSLPVLIPGPVRVFVRLTEIVGEAAFWNTVLWSFSRITGGFLIAFFTGLILAALSGVWQPLNYLLQPYVLVMKTVPVASFIIISLLWMKGRNLPTFITFIMVFPIIYTNVYEGIVATDKQLLEMAQVFRMSTGRKFLYIYLQSVKSHLISACKIALGVAWKAGVAAEVIGIVKGSIGEKIYESKLFLESDSLFAWTITLCLISVLAEHLFLALLKAIFKGLER